MTPYSQGPSGADAMTAFKYGWAKFQQHLGAIAIAIGVWIGAVIIVGLIGFLIAGAVSSLFTTTETIGGFEYETSSGGLFASLLVTAIYALFIFVASMAGNYGVIRGSLAITAGRAPTTGEMFNTANIVPFLLTSLLVGVITSIGSILCYLPGIVATFFLIFAPYYAADKGMGAVDSIKASVAAVQNNLGNMAAFFGLSILAYIAGAIVCGIGLLVAVPVIMLSSAYMYRSINGEPIAP